MKNIIELTFDESTLRELRAEMWSEYDEHQNATMKSKYKSLLWIGGIVLFFFSLTYFHTDWAFYGWLFIYVFAAYSLHVLWKYVSIINERKPRKTKEQDWYKHYYSVENIKYEYDPVSIDYFEENQRLIIHKWSQFDSYLIHEKYLYLNFGKEKRIWIPKSTVAEPDYEKLIDWLKENKLIPEEPLIAGIKD